MASFAVLTDKAKSLIISGEKCSVINIAELQKLKNAVIPRKRTKR